MNKRETSKPTFSVKAILAGILMASALSAFGQQLPGKHPSYLHALSDLRAARWCLMHQPGDAKVYADEDVAIQQLEAAIGDIKKAAIDDGKDLKDHPKVDVKDHGSRLLKSMEFIKKAISDVKKEEDDPTAVGLKKRSLDHLKAAFKKAEAAHAQWLKDKG